MADMTGPQMRLRFNDFMPDPNDPDIMRRVVDIQADVMTFENGMAILWLHGTEVGSFPLDALREAGFTPSPARAVPQPDNRAYTVEQVRKQHGNAYQRWTEEDDRQLLELHASGHDADALARHFSRQPSAIRARLAKLDTEPQASQPSVTPPF
ncbi:hypothetical protein [Streptomyces sp. NPDC089799]|uniref:hypothetical protein n=1 Tax=Streptomyces sp. NPDC089799 TaxID=3155066 RepID=UPI0034280068